MYLALVRQVVSSWKGGLVPLGNGVNGKKLDRDGCALYRRSVYSNTGLIVLLHLHCATRLEKSKGSVSFVACDNAPLLPFFLISDIRLTTLHCCVNLF